MNKILTSLFVGLMMAFLILPVVSADVIMPTLTKVYFEENGQPYNEELEFTVKGYGYRTGMPGDSEFNANRAPGTYTPEVVYTFNGKYEKYGDEIYQNYYRNYVHIDYYEVEIETENGETFVIENLESIPTNTINERNYDISMDGKYYRTTEEYNSCWEKIENYAPTYGAARDESTGATREDWKGEVWTKQEDGMWSSPSNPSLQRGDILIDEYPGGISYDKYMREEEVCDVYLEEVSESDLKVDEYGHPIEIFYEIRLDIADPDRNSTPPNRHYIPTTIDYILLFWFLAIPLIGIIGIIIILVKRKINKNGKK